MIMGAFFGASSLLLFSQNAYAKVDITLEDNTEAKSVTVSVNTNGSYIDGVDMTLVLSEDINITEIKQTDSFCTIGKSSKQLPGNKLALECFNDKNVEMTGMFAVLTYETEKDDYFFYLEEDTLDIGSLVLGTVTNINKPEITAPVETDEEEATTTEEEKDTLTVVRDFLKDNSMYVLAGVIFLIAITIGLVGLSSKETTTTE